MEELFSPAAP
ncbi:hypothetical protein PF007_g32178, partial [Phytophthora fragariae]